MEGLINTIIIRPYVFVFLLAFLFLSLWRWGPAKTLLWLISGYLWAWLSEYSSIHNGFPYGVYQYVYSNLQGELLVAGVPFFDSLSYTFLVFAGFTTACLLYTSPSPRDRQKSRMPSSA
jgi:putative membrane protein